MAENAVWLKVDEDGIVRALREALERLDRNTGELVLDFSSVHRIDSSALRALESLAGTLNGNTSRVVLRGVNIEVYKVLKLMKLAPQFSFRT